MMGNSKYDSAGMTEVDGGRLLGYLSEDIDIYYPPEDHVLLDNGANSDIARLIFTVPSSWVKNNRRGNPKELEELGWKKKFSKQKLLDDFASLAYAKPIRYLAFAKKWGPFWYQVATNDEDTQKLNSDDTSWTEDIFFWRLIAKEVRIILEIASYLRQEKLAKDSLWAELTYSSLAEEEYKTIEQQKILLADYVNVRGERINFENLSKNYSTAYFIRLRVDWSNKKPELFIATKMGFYSAMWLQLLQAITAKHVYVCSGCSRPYVRDRKPVEGRYNFCKDCRGKTNKASKRLHAQKKRNG